MRVGEIGRSKAVWAALLPLFAGAVLGAETSVTAHALTRAGQTPANVQAATACDPRFGCSLIVTGTIRDDLIKIETARARATIEVPSGVKAGNKCAQLSLRRVSCKGTVDTVDLDYGDDVLYISGDVGINSVVGNAGRDTIYGSRGDDPLLFGLGGRDEIHGRGGDDVIDGWFGRDRLFGGAGDDELRTYKPGVAHPMACGRGDDAAYRGSEDPQPRGDCEKTVVRH